MLIKDFLYKLKLDIFQFPSLTRYSNNNLAGGVKIDYDKYWHKRCQPDQQTMTSWQKQRADFVLKMIKPGSSVLDFGCGDGSILKYLKDKGAIKGIGVDVSDEVLLKAKAAGVEVVKKDINDLGSLSDLPQVDYALGFEVIEHMSNPEEFINFIKHKATKSVILSFPNSGYYIHRLRLLGGRFPLQWTSHPGEHLRFWTVKDVKWWIKAQDLKLEKMIIYEGLPILNKFFPSWFGQGIIIKIK